MPTFEEIYAHYGDDYDLMVSREDYQGRLLPMIAALRPLENSRVVEFGAGTGRLTRLLAPEVAHIDAFDASAHMLTVAERRMKQLGLTNWTLGVSDNAHLPVETGSADLAIAGWSFGHSVGWHADRWKEVIGEAVAEMLRVLRPGGAAIILETMTTGSEIPHPPTEGLAAYYHWLENEHDFQGHTLRTDYQFESLAEAELLTRFFFGDALADEVMRRNWVILPECTGLWVRYR